MAQWLRHSLCKTEFGLITCFLCPSSKTVEKLRFHLHMTLTVVWDVKHYQLSHLVGKPTMWFPNRFDTNRPVQLQK